MKNNSPKPIIINATALENGGGLSILYQFVANIPQKANEHWLIFVSPKIKLSSNNPNVIIQPIYGVKSFFKRFLWDSYSLKRWLIKHNIIPSACISLQNTGFRAGNKSTKHFIYYHQSIPFSRHCWNPFKKQERPLWFYKHIYPCFVKLYLRKRTRVYVQLDYIKQGFINRFHHSSDEIKVFTPDVKLKTSLRPNTTLEYDSINLFYPATPLFYKNHRVVAEAVNQSPAKIKFYTTTSNQNLGCDSAVQLGLLQASEVQWMYRHCDALVFPSYIETFGLPLIEAALTGMPVLAADLPYAREVLAGYEGARFIPHDKPEAWKDAFLSLEKGKRYPPVDLSSRPGWKELFHDIASQIQLNELTQQPNT